MTDVAAGSTAARQMQQNVYGAQYDQQNIDAAAQKTQLDLQQEQANIEKTKLVNLVTNTNFKAAEQSKTKLQQLTASPEFIAANDQSKLRLAAAIQFQSGDITNGVNTLDAVGKLEMKEVLKNLKQQEVTRNVIGNAYATIKNASTESSRTGTQAGEETTPFQSLIDNLPTETKELIKKEIPKFFEQTDQKLQKMQLEQLHLNASGQNNAATNETRLEIARISDQWRERNNATELQIAELRRAKGSGSDAEDRKAERQYNTSLRIARNVNNESKEKIELARAAWEKAAVVDRAEVWWRSGSNETRAKTREDKDELDSTIAWNKYQDLKREAVQKRIAAIEMMPEGPQKNRLLTGLDNEFATTFKNAPTEADEKASKVKPTSIPLAESAAPSASAAKPIVRPAGPKSVIDTTGTDPNTGLPKDTGLKQRVEASGQKYEPTKFDYRVLPDGSVQRKVPDETVQRKVK
jgi:hypothetical protein